MKKILKYSVIVIIIILISATILFNFVVNINTYSEPVFTIMTHKSSEEAKELEKNYDPNDLEMSKKISYLYTYFFDFSADDIICEFRYSNSVLFQDPRMRKVNIYAVLYGDKTIKYIVDSIGTMESIEERYKYNNVKKAEWLYCEIDKEESLKLTDSQYKKLINLLKLLGLFHNKNSEFYIGEGFYKDRDVYYFNGAYYNSNKDKRFLANLIEKNLGDYLRTIIYDDWEKINPEFRRKEEDEYNW